MEGIFIICLYNCKLFWKCEVRLALYSPITFIVAHHYYGLAIWGDIMSSPNVTLGIDVHIYIL